MCELIIMRPPPTEEGRIINEVLNLLKLLCMRNGKLIGPTHCDATSVDSMQYWYASETNWTKLNSTNHPPKWVAYKGKKSWKLIRIPDPWKESQVFF